MAEEIVEAALFRNEPQPHCSTISGTTRDLGQDTRRRSRTLAVTVAPPSYRTAHASLPDRASNRTAMRGTSHEHNSLRNSGRCSVWHLGCRGVPRGEPTVIRHYARLRAKWLPNYIRAQELLWDFTRRPLPWHDGQYGNAVHMVLVDSESDGQVAARNGIL